ncbi:Calx-beta domain-containing protein [Leifsonia sp. NPDC058292]|uniref:Calx-beta domain-containing protein n=1 Tax=Leifsonia sp. NPDC058292 TaxID=3346428 RepID=UPI0036D9831B
MIGSNVCARLAFGALITAAAVFAPAAAALAVPQPAPDAVLVPLVDCVADAPLDGTATTIRTIVFGYSNSSSAAVESTAGSAANSVSNGAPDRGQPSTFAPGEHHGVWTLTVDAASVLPAWTLGAAAAGASATATSATVDPTTPACSAATSIALSAPATSRAGDDLTVTAAVTRMLLAAPADGLVEFTVDGSAAVSSPVASGVARAQLRLPQTGTHTVAARFVPADGSGMLESRAQAVVAVGSPSGALVLSTAGTSADGTSALLQVSRVSANGPATVDFVTADGTARAGVDYAATRGSVSLKDGQTTATIAVPLKARSATAKDGTFFVLLQRASAPVDVAGASVTLSAAPAAAAGGTTGAVVITTPPRSGPQVDSVLPAGDPTAAATGSGGSDLVLMLGAGLLTVGGIAGVVGLFRIGTTRGAQA